MYHSNSIRTAIFVACGVMTSITTTTEMKGQEKPMETVKNIVLVHGAWADASSWSKIIPRVASEGISRDSRS